MAESSPDRPDTYIPEDVRCHPDLSSFTPTQIDALLALCPKRFDDAIACAADAELDVQVWAFTGLAPPAAYDPPPNATAYDRMLREYLQQHGKKNAILKRRVVGALIGEGLVTRRKCRHVLMLQGLYAAPGVDAHEMRAHMLDVAKRLTDDMGFDEIRVRIAPDEPALEQEADWFWLHGFKFRGYKPSKDAYEWSWNPDEQSMPIEQAPA